MKVYKDRLDPITGEVYDTIICEVRHLSDQAGYVLIPENKDLSASIVSYQDFSKLKIRRVPNVSAMDVILIALGVILLGCVMYTLISIGKQ